MSSNPNIIQLQLSIPNLIGYLPVSILSMTYFLRKKYNISPYIKYIKEMGLIILCVFFSLFYINNGTTQNILRSNMLIGGSITYGLMNMILSDKYVSSNTLDSFVNFMLG